VSTVGLPKRCGRRTDQPRRTQRTGRSRENSRVGSRTSWPGCMGALVAALETRRRTSDGLRPAAALRAQAPSLPCNTAPGSRALVRAGRLCAAEGGPAADRNHGVELRRPMPGVDRLRRAAAVGRHRAHVLGAGFDLGVKRDASPLDAGERVSCRSVHPSGSVRGRVGVLAGALDGRVLLRQLTSQRTLGAAESAPR
jgi:hypothetical protein